MARCVVCGTGMTFTESNIALSFGGKCKECLNVNQEELDTLIIKANQNEENTNQILDFTREVKKLDEKDKIKIIKSLWRIIYSNKDADMYEANLMRRLSGLLYIDSKTMGDIKEQIKKENL